MDLVTGGLGFLGSHLVERLLAEGREVTVVDNAASAVVDPAERGWTCDVVLQDIAAYAPRHAPRFDRIFHLADIAGPYRILQYAGTIGARSIAGLDRVLQLATPGHTRLVLVSSSEIYGRPGSFPESTPATIYTPYTVRLEYAVAKSLNEVSALNYGQRTGLQVNVVRPFNIAGPRQSSRGGFVIPRFFEAALAGDPLTVFGTGKQIRSFTHVLDTVQSLLAVADCAGHGEVFNSGNPRNTTTIADLAERIKALCASSSPIDLVDPRELFGPHYAEAFDKIPDTAKIETMLGWRPEHDLQQLLDDTLAEYRTAAPAGPGRKGAAR
jgi:nucleoside-diphosphate-sugar epimerase